MNKIIADQMLITQESSFKIVMIVESNQSVATSFDDICSLLFAESDDDKEMHYKGKSYSQLRLLNKNELFIVNASEFTKHQESCVEPTLIIIREDVKNNLDVMHGYVIPHKELAEILVFNERGCSKLF